MMQGDLRADTCGWAPSAYSGDKARVGGLAKGGVDRGLRASTFWGLCHKARGKGGQGQTPQPLEQKHRTGTGGQGHRHLQLWDLGWSHRLLVPSALI